MLLLRSNDPGKKHILDMTALFHKEASPFTERYFLKRPKPTSADLRKIGGLPEAVWKILCEEGRELSSSELAKKVDKKSGIMVRKEAIIRAIRHLGTVQSWRRGGRYVFFLEVEKEVESIREFCEREDRLEAFLQAGGDILEFPPFHKRNEFDDLWYLSTFMFENELNLSDIIQLKDGHSPYKPAP